VLLAFVTVLFMADAASSEAIRNSEPGNDWNVLETVERQADDQLSELGIEPPRSLE
jgi:hypothetical protein